MTNRIPPGEQGGRNDPFSAIRRNEAISVPTVRVISADGDQLGILRTSDALQRARDAGLDLVEIVSSVHPPVCQIMDFAKYVQTKKAERKDDRSFGDN